MLNCNNESGQYCYRGRFKLLSLLKPVCRAVVPVEEYVLHDRNITARLIAS